MDARHAHLLWRFIRGDLPVSAFEAWIYGESGLEAVLGEALYMELISTDYRDRDAVFNLREKLKAVLMPDLGCECPTIKDEDVIRMGFEGRDKRFFATVDTVLKHGGDQWWFYLAHCRACHQDWMVAQEERIYDDYYLKRLGEAEATCIVEDRHWPEDFLTYERVLQQGQKLSTAYRFDDPMAKSLVWTVEDLGTAQPDIDATRIGELLGIDEAHAERLIAASTKT